ncbi:hypothetical protein [Salipiger aestuarii]|nr:hypothetical protein [Salipiger aestuarii]
MAVLSGNLVLGWAGLGWAGHMARLAGMTSTAGLPGRLVSSVR